MCMSQNLDFFAITRSQLFFLPFSFPFSRPFWVFIYGQSLEIDLDQLQAQWTIAPKLTTSFFNLLPQNFLDISNWLLYGKVYPSSTIRLLDFLMLVIFMLINQHWEFNLIRFPFSELNYGIARGLNYVNLGKNLSKNIIHQFLLAVLGNENDYVDVSTLMLKITNYH